MKNKFAILIPTLVDRQKEVVRLLQELSKQITSYTGIATITESVNHGNANIHVTHFGPIGIILNMDNGHKNGGKTTGNKRNECVEAAIQLGFEYGAHFDDDDLPGKTYIKNQMAVVDSGKDCGELWGNIYFSGKKGKPFHHSIIYKKWDEDKYIYKRTPNHLNCTRLDILKEFPFPDQVFGEDGQQSEKMAAAGVLKTMHPMEDVIYHYFTGHKGTELEKEIIKELLS